MAWPVARTPSQPAPARGTGRRPVLPSRLPRLGTEARVEVQDPGTKRLVDLGLLAVSAASLTALVCLMYMAPTCSATGAPAFAIGSVIKLAGCS
jgi:hypothetical protein